MKNENPESLRRTKNLKYLRISNRAEIIRSLSVSGPISRVELSRQLGLSKMAISAIVADMIDEGLVKEQGTYSPSRRSGKPSPTALSAVGRRPSILTIEAQRINALGLYLSRDAIEGVLCDVSGKILMTWKSSLDELTNSAGYLQMLADILDEMQKFAAGLHIIGIGISCIGPIDIVNGKLLSHRISMISMICP